MERYQVTVFVYVRAPSDAEAVEKVRDSFNKNPLRQPKDYEGFEIPRVPARWIRDR